MLERFVEVAAGHYIAIDMIRDIIFKDDTYEITTPGRSILVEKGCVKNIRRLLGGKKKKEKLDSRGN